MIELAMLALLLAFFATLSKHLSRSTLSVIAMQRAVSFAISRYSFIKCKQKPNKQALTTIRKIFKVGAPIVG